MFIGEATEKNTIKSNFRLRYPKLIFAGGLGESVETTDFQDLTTENLTGEMKLNYL